MIFCIFFTNFMIVNVQFKRLENRSLYEKKKKKIELKSLLNFFNTKNILIPDADQNKTYLY